MREIRIRSRAEFDFLKEADALARVGASMRAHFGRAVLVPAPLPRLSSARLLAMEYVPGPTLAAQIGADVRAAVGGPNFARLLARARGEEEGALRAPSRAQRARLLVAAPRLWAIRRGVGARLRLLARVHGHQIFVDGRFNSDPHGGNVLVCPDGRLGLIDYGQVRELGAAQRAKLCALVLALSDPAATDATIARLFRALGFTSARRSDVLACRLARIMYDADETCGREPAAVLRELGQLDVVQSLPIE